MAAKEYTTLDVDDLAERYLSVAGETVNHLRARHTVPGESRRVQPSRAKKAR